MEYKKYNTRNDIIKWVFGIVIILLMFIGIYFAELPKIERNTYLFEWGIFMAIPLIYCIIVLFRPYKKKKDEGTKC